jgi:hypothetical protein
MTSLLAVVYGDLQLAVGRAAGTGAHSGYNAFTP